MVKTPTAQQSASKRNNEPNEFEKQVAIWTKVLGIATILLFIASLVADCFIFQQWRSVIDTQTDARNQLRAFVTFTGASQAVNNTGTTTINYIFLPQFKNWGSTRTNHFKGWTSVQYFDGIVPNSQDFSRPYIKIKTPDSIIGPNGIAGFAVSLPAGDAIKVKNGKGVVVIWGHVEWSDIYNPDDLHPIDFCLKLDPVSSSGDNNIIFQPSPFRDSCNSG